MAFVDVGKWQDVLQVYVKYAGKFIKIEGTKTDVTYTRYNLHLKAREYAGYGAGLGTMNQDYFTYDKLKSKTFFNKPVLSLKSVCWMNPRSLIEKVPVPDRLANKMSLFMYHAYGKHFSVNCNMNVWIREANETETWGDRVIEKPFPPSQANAKIKRQPMLEHMMDVEVPDKYRGKLVEINAEVYANTGNWKEDWHFEGWSVVFNQKVE